MAAGPTWRSFVTGEKQRCVVGDPCWVSVDGRSFAVAFAIKEEEGVRTLEKVEITDVREGKKQTFEVPEVNQLEGRSQFELFEINRLEPGRPVDLALFAFDTAREGSMYYYFLYEPVQRRFVISPEPVPREHPSQGL